MSHSMVRPPNIGGKTQEEDIKKQQTHKQPIPTYYVMVNSIPKEAPKKTPLQNISNQSNKSMS